MAARHPREPPAAQVGRPLLATRRSGGVCAWYETGADGWRCGSVAFGAGESDGAEWPFDLLVDGSPGAYVKFAEGYYERPVDPGAVAAVLAGAPLTRRTVALPPTADFDAVATQARTLGFSPLPGPLTAASRRSRGLMGRVRFFACGLSRW